MTRMLSPQRLAMPTPWPSDKDRGPVNDRLARPPRAAAGHGGRFRFKRWKGNRTRVGLALGVFLVGLCFLALQESHGMEAPYSKLLTLDCDGAPSRLCSALVEALSAARPYHEIQVSPCPGPGPHVRLEMSRIAADGLTGRLILEEPGGTEQTTPFLEVRVMDHPGGLPDSTWADFARTLLEIGYSREEKRE